MRVDNCLMARMLDADLSAARIARAGPGRIALLRTVPQIEVTKQAYFGTVVKDLQARVQDEPCHRCIGELGRNRRALRSGKPSVAEASHTLDPQIVGVIELTECFLGSARIVEGRDVRRRAVKVAPVHLRESNDQVSEPPGDGGHRLRILRLTEIPGEFSRPE